MRALALVGLAACSSSSSPAPAAPPPPAPAPAAICADVQLGGYAGTPACAATARTTVLGADRTCRTNADCIRIGPHCAPVAIRADRTDAYPSVPCTDPAGGQCPPPCAAVCERGCCAIPAGWGEHCR